MNLTPLLRPVFARRVRAAQSWQGRIREVQTRQLLGLLHTARRTAYGTRYGFDRIRSYADYAATVPATAYADLRPHIMRMIDGQPDILWPGRCRRFAQSSGTSDGKSKFIPVTDHSLRLNHYPGARDTVAHYLHLYPDSRIFSGKALILGGSFANELTGLPPHVTVGDLSANLIDAINPAVNLMRVPSRDIALMADWNKKLPAIIEAASRCDITNISGVPSWFLTLLRRALDTCHAATVHDIWPNLEVFFHGGISFTPYREQYRAITDPARMRYLETYNASEGFFAVQDLREPGTMRLLLDTGVFYEFVPLGEPDTAHPHAIPAWEVEPGRTYALLITAPNGLWRYAIGDTVRVHSADPLRISIAGRTRSYINAFGEELMVHNAEAAIAAAAGATGAQVLNYTAAPVYPDATHRGRHQWLIEWAREPHSTAAFAEALDTQLQSLNSDYQAKRTGTIFLDPPAITTAAPGLFDRWLASTGKLGGQRKIPRLANDRTIMDTLLGLMHTP
ncbi:MAG: GH3 auxin-responsive promoter family protein [Muribaculaceae bacterium]|nr:GH3 auxin-responsive promoter family protein [Muribaculaceae bacterium]